MNSFYNYLHYIYIEHLLFHILYILYSLLLVTVAFCHTYNKRTLID